TFTPTVTGTRSGAVSVSDNASGSPHTAGLTDTNQTPLESPYPNSAPAGNRLENTKGPAQTVTLSNNGGAALTINWISLTGINPGGFAYTHNYPTSPATQSFPTRRSSDLTFTPTVTGPRSGTVSVSDNASGSPHTAGL